MRAPRFIDEMTRRTTIATVVVAVALVAAVVATGRFRERSADKARLREAYEAGRAEATVDVRAGILRIKTTGALPLVTDSLAEHLARRYGISYGSIGDGVSPMSENCRRGYNEVAIAEIERRFERGFLDRAAREAVSQPPASTSGGGVGNPSTGPVGHGGPQAPPQSKGDESRVIFSSEAEKDRKKHFRFPRPRNAPARVFWQNPSQNFSLHPEDTHEKRAGRQIG